MEIMCPVTWFVRRAGHGDEPHPRDPRTRHRTHGGLDSNPPGQGSTSLNTCSLAENEARLKITKTWVGQSFKTSADYSLPDGSRMAPFLGTS